jgi:hypothetical protein
MKVALAPPTATTVGRRPGVVVALMGWGIGLGVHAIAGFGGG